MFSDCPGHELTVDSEMSGFESDVAHAFSVPCRHSCRHPTAQQEGRRTKKTYRQE